MRIELREDLKIQNILENKEIDKKINLTIRLLTKHYHSKGMNKDQIYNAVDKFMRDNCREYNSVTWFDNVESTIKSVLKYDSPIVCIKSVNITKSELEYIEKIKTIKHKKLAFTYLVYAKILNQINPNNKNWVNSKYRNEIFKDAYVTDTGKDQLITIHRMVVENILTLAKSITNNSISVDNYINENDEVVWIVNDFRELGLQYLNYIGENKDLTKCEECGQIVKIKVNNQKYCKKCAKKMKKERNKNYMKNMRK